MSTRLVICRHGNTFGPNDTPTRVGARTDLPLVDTGIEQAKAIGEHFRAKSFEFNRIFCSPLLRTRQTAENALVSMGLAQDVDVLNFLGEIDYGPDENKPEADVIARIGQDALTLWDQHAIAPEGWIVDTDFMIGDWLSFGEYAKEHFKDQTILLVTSNGTARFAPYLTGDYDAFRADNDIKLKTGAYGILSHNGESWQSECWNVRPDKI
jgi:probable phosphoglycerate mutase